MCSQIVLPTTIMTALNAFNKLSPKMKSLYVTSLVLSVALVVFGAVLLTSTDGQDATTIITSEENYVAESGGDTINLDVGSSDSTLDNNDEEVSTLLPLDPTLTPTYLRQVVEETLQPSTEQPTPLPTIMNSYYPSSSPIMYQSTKPSIQDSAMPSTSPTDYPSTLSPSYQPTPSPTTDNPTPFPSTNTPTLYPSTNMPSLSPSFNTPSYPPSTSAPPTNKPTLSTPFPYYNYDNTSQYGPDQWHNLTILNSTDNYWREWGKVENQCNNEMQSPIDVCTKPERHCKEYHEFRSKRGDFRIDNDLFMMKEILPNKLRVVVARRVGEEPDPAHADFAAVGQSDLDLLNIDIKIPAEHTICGRRYDGEMQYYFFHPVKQALLVVSWLFEANDDNPENDHMQLLIDQFQEVYDDNNDVCSGGRRSLKEGRKLPKDDNQKQGGKKIWNPFDRDIQQTIHFWGYTGSLTEPPCSTGTLWRIMDVPVQLSTEQLTQMQTILFSNRDPSSSCAFTSVHDSNMSVARPTQSQLRYYKCTRDDYVSDEERAVCGDEGCEDYPFSTNLDPYVGPIQDVTGPPSLAPTSGSPSSSPV